MRRKPSYSFLGHTRSDRMVQPRKVEFLTNPPSENVPVGLRRKIGSTSTPKIYPKTGYVTHVTTFASDHHDLAVETEGILSIGGGARAFIVRMLQDFGCRDPDSTHTPCTNAPLLTFEKVLIIPLPRNERDADARTQDPLSRCSTDKHLLGRTFIAQNRTLLRSLLPAEG